MNTKKFWMLALVMMIVASPVFAGEATQMWRCEMDDDASEAQVVEGAAKWLAAAKKLDGGANFTAQVFFPVAVNGTGEMDMMYVITAPSFAEWGKFWDAYSGSEAAAIEQSNNALVICPDSVLWESVNVK